MIRTQIQITEAQARALRNLAHDEGRSVSDLIREGIENVLKRSERADRWQRATAAVGRFRSGQSDIATEHDRYLDEDYR